MIELSSHAPEDFSQMAVTLDMKPGLTEEQVDLRLQRDFAENIRKQLSSVLTGLMPARMAPVFAKLCGVDADTPINQARAAAGDWPRAQGTSASRRRHEAD